MLKFLCLSLLGLIPAALAHGDHESPGPAKGETIQEYAQRHVGSSIIGERVLAELTFCYTDVFRASYVRIFRYNTRENTYAALPLVTPLTFEVSSSCTT